MADGGNEVSVDVSQSSVTYESLIPTEPVDRPDTLPVFADDQNGSWRKPRRIPGDKKYVPTLPSHRWHCCNLYRKRELVVLVAGVLLMCLALTLIATGAIRVHVCNDLKHEEESKDDGQGTQAKTKPNLAKLFSINNFALEKTCSQSSTDESGLSGRANLAVDGRTETCARTDLEMSPFWQVDLGTLRPIGDIIVRGKDKYVLHDFQILVSEKETFASYSQCYHQTKVSSTQFKVECPDNVNGRFVRFRINKSDEEKTERLVLCEVIVLER